MAVASWTNEADYSLSCKSFGRNDTFLRTIAIHLVAEREASV